MVLEQFLKKFKRWEDLDNLGYLAKLDAAFDAFWLRIKYLRQPFHPKVEPGVDVKALQYSMWSDEIEKPLVCSYTLLYVQIFQGLYGYYEVWIQ